MANNLQYLTILTTFQHSYHFNLARDAISVSHNIAHRPGIPLYHMSYLYVPFPMLVVVVVITTATDANRINLIVPMKKTVVRVLVPILVAER